MDTEREELEHCPLCAHDTDTSDDDYTDWIQCENCSTWFHLRCLGMSKSQCDRIEQYHCESCTKVHGPSTYKPERRKSTRERTQLNYADLNEGNTADQQIWAKLLATKTFAKEHFPRYPGNKITREFLDKTGLKEPFIVENPEGLDMKMPPASTTVRDVADSVGRDYPVDVIDVATQSEQQGWTMGRWADYYHSPRRDRIRNVISLEITGTEFAENIERPRIVRELDWIDHMWPKDIKPEEYPKVQLYCLMGTKDSYTDFHIDFGGSSVFYHIVSGSKVFYFIEPTDVNLKKYQKWSSSSEQSTTFFGDEVKACYAVYIKAGNTMIIPSGWIHAVYTPEDALVIGGNFLHGYNIKMQLKIYEIEQITQVPLKFQFPYFLRMNLYAAMRYKELLEQGAPMSRFELESILSLSKWFLNTLQAEPKKREKGSQEFSVKLGKTDIPPGLKNTEKFMRGLIKLVEPKVKEFKQEAKAIKRSSEEESSPAPDQIKRIRVMAQKPEKSAKKPPKNGDEGDDEAEFLQGKAYDEAILGDLEEEDKKDVTFYTGGTKNDNDDYAWDGNNDDFDEKEGDTYAQRRRPSSKSTTSTSKTRQQPKKQSTTVKERLLARIEKPPKRR